MVAIAGFVVLGGQTGVPLYVSALAVLGVNRFFLSAVSAGTPHVVQRDKLVMANAVAPTSGTIVGFAGGVVGLGVHLVTGGGLAGSAATLWFAGACYVAASLLGTRLAKNLLGPSVTTAAGQAGLRGTGQRHQRAQGCLRRPRRGAQASQRAEKGRLRPRCHRRAPRPVRHAARRGAAALPQLLLLGWQREQGARQRHPAGNHVGDRLRPRRGGDTAGRQAADQGPVDRHLAAHRRRGRRSSSAPRSTSTRIWCSASPLACPRSA